MLELWAFCCLLSQEPDVQCQVRWVLLWNQDQSVDHCGSNLENGSLPVGRCC